MPQRGRRQRPTQSPPPFRISESEDYKYVYATGGFGNMTPNDCLIIFYLDRLNPEIVPGGSPGEMRPREVNRELQVEVHMTPTQFRSIAEWMSDHVDKYEERFGEIQEPPEEEDNPLVE